MSDNPNSIFFQSVSGEISENEIGMGKSYVQWACAGCYGLYFISGMVHGIENKSTVKFSRNTTIKTKIGDSEITLSKQKYNKTLEAKHKFFRGYGHAANGPIDTTYVSYLECSDSSNDKFESYGSYSASSEKQSSVIYYADLREDILVYFHETSTSDCPLSSNTQPMGLGIGFAEWQGADQATCRGVNTLDAVKLSTDVSSSRKRKELITKGAFTAYSNEINGIRNRKLAIRTGAATCGGVSNDCVQWGGYARIDENKDYSCKDGIYEDEVLAENLYLYVNTWDSNSEMDAYDNTQWIGLAKDGWDNGRFLGRVIAGTYDYPSFINIDPMPHGSFVSDAAGNLFYSMITFDEKNFNKISEGTDSRDPNLISNLTGDDVVYFPVAPV